MGVVGDVIRGVIGGAGDVFGTGYSVYQDQRNFDYQKELQQELWRRDDTAMQRRMSDLSAAGVNPLLALGSSSAGNTSAGTGAGATVSSPDFKILERKQQIQNLEVGREQIKSLEKDNQLRGVNIDIKKLEREILQKQIDQYNEAGYYPQSWLGKGAMDVNNIVGEVLGNIFQTENPNLFHPIDLFRNIFSGATFNLNPKPITVTNPLASLVHKIGGKDKDNVTEYKFTGTKHPLAGELYKVQQNFRRMNKTRFDLHYIPDSKFSTRGVLKLYDKRKKRYESPDFIDLNSVIRYLNYGSVRY